MKDHFSYLLTDTTNDFFQKIAVEEATSSIRATTQVTGSMVKKAAARSVSAFEKVASRLDRDLGVLRTAGECGINAGMQKRANAYIDVVLNQTDLSADEFGEIFDKVAAEAIQVDLEAAYHQLCRDLPEDQHHHVGELLVKVGHEVTELALMEKEAIVGKILGGAARWIGRRGGPSGVKQVASGVGGALRSAAGAPGRAAQRVVDQGRKGRVQALHKAREKLPAKIEMNLGISKDRSAGRQQQAYAKSQAAKQQQQLGGVEKALSQRKMDLAAKKSALRETPEAQAMLAKKGKLPGGYAAETIKMPAQSPGGANTTAPPKSAPAAQTKAPEAPKGPGESGPIPISKDPNHPSNKGTGTDGPSPKAKAEPDPGSSMTNIPASPPGGAEGKSEGFMSSWKKLSEGGWKSLNPAEKGSLIRGGVTAAMVGRAVTGHGVVTGGEGLI